MMSELGGYPRTQPRVGDKAEFRKTLTEAEQAFFTGISGNMHPLYVNEVHAARTEVGGRLAFELAVAALATTALAKVGGPYRRVAAIEFRYPLAARVGDTIAAAVEVTEVSGRMVRCRITCRKDSGAVAAEGSADLIELIEGER